MREKITALKHSGIFVKTEHSDAYVPQHPSPEARICLDCDPNKQCKGNCKRYIEERRKLKEQQNER
jgi:radical SAM protein with 4Fe4S-binding SPASM domain